jgi:hypothetical protein
MVSKRLYLDDAEDETLLVAEVDKQYSGIRLLFEGPMYPLNFTSKKSVHGYVDKALMYRFCKRMITLLEKEGIK